ncbi:MAG: DUF3021 domain-containing protein [Clostridia bacterium]|nr:DUF3021 domain-containing protein [Clostridia bacterium]
MKRFITEFFRRGLIACGFGPIVLAVLYLILYYKGLIDTLTVNQVCTGIFSITVLAFTAGGMNAVYHIERLPLMSAILIHGIILYFSYLSTYLLNDWLKLGLTPILVFSGIFVVGYLAVWAIIYCVTKRNTKKLNEMLKEKQQKIIDDNKQLD